MFVRRKSSHCDNSFLVDKGRGSEGEFSSVGVAQVRASRFARNPARPLCKAEAAGVLWGSLKLVHCGQRLVLAVCATHSISFTAQ